MADVHSQKSHESCNLNQSKEMSQTVHEHEPHRDEICEKITGLSGFRCKYCSFHARSVVKVRRHCYFKHLFYRPYGCPYCAFLSMEANKIVQHCVMRHPENLATDVQIKFGDPRGTKYGNLGKKFSDQPPKRTRPAPALQSSVNIKVSQPLFEMTAPEVLMNYQCGHCGHGYVAEEDFLKHIINFHSNIKVYRCKICFFATNDLTFMKKHHNEIHKPITSSSSRKTPYTGDIKDAFKAIHIRKTSSGISIGSLMDLFQRKNSGDSILLDWELKVIRYYGKLGSSNEDIANGDFVSYPIDDLFPNVHLGSKSMSCLYCNFYSQSYNINHLFDHVVEFHSCVKPFHCTECSFTSNCRDRVTLHSAIEHETIQDSVLEDKVKGVPLRSLVTVREHRTFVQLQLDESILAENSVETDLFDCNYTAALIEVKKMKGNSLFNYFVQNRLQSVKRFCCGSCSFICDRYSVGDLFNHIAVAHFDDINLFTCSICGYVDSSPTAVISHQQSIHPKAGPSSVYGYYEDVFPYLSMTHSSKDDSIVLTISEDIAESEDIEDSLDKKRNGMPTDGYYCHYCGLYYNSYNDIVLHLISAHSTLTPFSCYHCNFATGSIEVMKRHFCHLHPETKIKSIRQIIDDSEVTQLICSKQNTGKKTRNVLYFAASVSPLLADKTTTRKNVRTLNKPAVVPSVSNYVCLHCLYYSSSLENMYVHVLWKHYENPLQRLFSLQNQDLCNKIQLFSDLEGISLRDGDCEAEIKCRLCDSKSVSQASFLAHFIPCFNSISQSRGNPWCQCFYCNYGESADTITHSLVDHIQTNHSDKFKEGFPIRSLLQHGNLHIFGAASWQLIDFKEKTQNFDINDSVKMCGVFHCYYCGEEIPETCENAEDNIKNHFEAFHKEKTKFQSTDSPMEIPFSGNFLRHNHGSGFNFEGNLISYRKILSEEDKPHYEVYSKVPELNTSPYFCGHCGFHKEFYPQLLCRHISDIHSNLIESEPHFDLSVDKSDNKVISLVSPLASTPFLDRGDSITNNLDNSAIAVSHYDFCCSHCGHMCKTFLDGYNHLASVHNNLWKLKCVYCMEVMADLNKLIGHTLCCHKDHLCEINCHSLITLEMPSDYSETTPSGKKLTLTMGINSNISTGVQKTAVKFWCCGYCNSIAPTKSRDVVMKHISTAHKQYMKHLHCMLH